jgi:hypothetical protein
MKTIFVQQEQEVIMTALRERKRMRAPVLAVLKGAAAVALACGIAQAQPAPPIPPSAVQPGQPAPPPPGPGDQPPVPPGRTVEQAAVQFSGSIVGYNYGPKGNYESVLLKSGDKLSQVNFPPDAGGVIAQAARVGDNVQVTATPDMGMPDHGVYELVSLTPANGQPLTIAGPDAWRVQHVDGVVKSVNYGRRGEVNGAVLDDGDFVHLGPEGATLIRLSVGQKLAIDGYTRPMLAGHNVIEADSVNGTSVRTAPPPPPPDGPAGPRPRGRGPRPGDAPPPPPPGPR